MCARSESVRMCVYVRSESVRVCSESVRMCVYARSESVCVLAF